MLAMNRSHSPIFIDYSGRRWRHIRRAALVVGVLTTVVALVLVGTVVLYPPMPPELPLAVANNHQIARATTGKPGVYTKVDRLRTAYRRKLAAAMKHYGGAPTSRSPEAVPVLYVGSGSRPTRTESIVAGFYINWEDNSFASLKRNYDKLDWVIGEWAFISPGSDSLTLRIDKRVVALLNNQPPETRPSLFIMLSNFVVSGRDSAKGHFDAQAVRAFLGSPAARANAVRQLRETVQQYGLAGTTLDMESLDPTLGAQGLAVACGLYGAVHGLHKLAPPA